MIALLALTWHIVSVEPMKPGDKCAFFECTEAPCFDAQTVTIEERKPVPGCVISCTTHMDNCTPCAQLTGRRFRFCASEVKE